MAEESCVRVQVLEDVRAIISEQLGTDIKEVKADSKFVDLGADSLDTVEIMMALEEKFDIQLDEEGAEKISTVQVQKSAQWHSLHLRICREDQRCSCAERPALLHGPLHSLEAHCLEDVDAVHFLAQVSSK
jgi:acyl carrier protein